ncbi:MAG: serine acetyltransferase [Proteobacteria bacterium]|nr:serine acetyltransferase [Pseudomonadota bacterium]MBU4469366.1 serine acetyltransferase [Pseudomonadota bacterium]MCG2750479.1 serine acetyltransferase [Desulfobacteraceae bacterium]
MTHHQNPSHLIPLKSTCKTEAVSASRFREKLPGIVDQIIHGCKTRACHTHIDFDPIFSKEKIIEIIHKLREVIFPGYFDSSKIDPVNLSYAMGQSVSFLFELLSQQITYSIRHDCFRYDLTCQDCEKMGYENALSFLSAIPEIQRLLNLDVQACFDGDPAAKNLDEIIFCYPGVFAIMVYRVAHKLHELGVPFIPRIMTEYAHGETGIDIHPGARIGEGFVIDHGTGVVIGETTLIGNNVRIYQGVTLGALSLPRNAGEELRGKKRHPSIEDEVIIYSGATILGGHTRIGARSVIGGNVWITESVPPDTKVLLANPQLIYK